MSIESGLFWASVLLYAVATLVLAGGFAFRRPKWEDVAFATTCAGFAAQTASIAVRAAGAGRLPYVEHYENLMAGVWFMVAAYIGIGAWRRDLRSIGGLILPAALLTLGYAMTFDRGIGAESPSTKSVWLGVHVLFAWFTYASYTACAGLAMIELLKGRKKGVRPGALLERAPEVPRLQEIAFRLVALGFLVNGVMIASGGIWAYELWGSYWRWDPVETWSLATWLAFGFYMHAYLTLGWRGKRLAWLALVSLFGVMMMFWGVQVLPSLLGSRYHLFENLGDLIRQTPGVR